MSPDQGPERRDLSGIWGSKAESTPRKVEPVKKVVEMPTGSAKPETFLGKIKKKLGL